MRVASPEDFGHLAGVLVRAFREDPFHRWLFPDDRRRARRQRRLFERVLAIYARHGVVYTSEDRSGVALWDPPRSGGPGLLETLEFLVLILPVFGLRASKVAEGMAPLAALHPRRPHWYLSLLATDPERQRRGIATSLMTPILGRCDEDDTPACLEASRYENVAWYERFGFEVVTSLAMPSGPSVYRMMRNPVAKERASKPPIAMDPAIRVAGRRRHEHGHEEGR
jgi:ribosomal protein S18 acetylase RimI-like enzyme